MFKYIKLTILALLIIPSSSVFGKNYLANFYNHFQKKNYDKALTQLDAIDFSAKTISTKYYLKGICYAKLFDLEKSIKNFKKAITLKNDAKDLYYEYGQMLYANNDLEKARDSFLKSYKVHYKPVVSLYYMAHTSQILEDHRRAKNIYYQIVQDELATKDMQQVSHFQLAQSIFSLAEKNEDKKVLKKVVKNYVLPLLEKAEDMDSNSNIAKDIRSTKKQLKRRFDLDPNVLRNGKTLKEKRYTLYIDQKIKSDDNVTNTSDEIATETPTNKDSFIYDTTLLAKYRFVFLRAIEVSPELILNNLQHSNQDNADVYTGDSHYYNISLKNAYHHKIGKNKAKLSLDISYNKTYKDYEMTHNNLYYGKTWQYTIAEKVKIIPYKVCGKTTLKFKIKDYTAYTDNLSSDSKVFSFSQKFRLPYRHSVSFSLDYDQTTVVNDDNSTDAITYSLSYSIPNIFKKISLSISPSITSTDTKAQQATRGTEKKTSIPVSISKDFFKKSLDTSLSYTYTDNESLDTRNNAYTKSVIALGLKYKF